jgi:acyl dehydratase
MTSLNLDAVGTETEPREWSWASKDCVLYALGVGAGVDEGPFTTEFDQQVLPTFATVIGAIGGAWDRLGHKPGTIAHGEQAIEMNGPLPPDGRLLATSRLVAIYDKGSGALAVGESTARDVETGEILFTGRSAMFIRGEGGWGGDRGPTGARVEPPDREPDHVVREQTLSTQALLYRLSGDYNPLHADPAFAHRAGFERPILHGLCTYGFAGRALLSRLCGGDPEIFGGMEARFARPVVPGDELVTKIWETPASGDTGHHAVFVTESRTGDVVLSGGGFRRAGAAS